MKTDSVFKRAFNDARDIVVGIGSGGALPSENELSEQLGVSSDDGAEGTVSANAAEDGLRVRPRAVCHGKGQDAQEISAGSDYFGCRPG